MKRLKLLALMLMGTTVVSFASQKRKVLMIGIDGTRADALQAANTPNIDSLIATGAYTFDSWHTGITVSGPSWSSIFTGVNYMKHGVTDNSYSGSHFDQYHEFPKLAKEYKPNLYAAEVIEWAPLVDNVPNQYDGYNSRIKVPDGSTTPTGSTAVTQLLNSNMDVLTVYFDAVDLAGHANGFSPNNPSYITAIQSVDAQIGNIITALHNRPNYANEDWLILVTTDHGGLGTGHGGNSNDERHIWWIGSGNHVIHKQLFGADPGSYRIVPPGVDTAILHHTPVQADIAVTALHHLIYDENIRPDTVQRWALDGKSLLDSIHVETIDTTGNDTTSNPTAVGNVASQILDVKLYPNPSAGLFTFWFDPNHQKVSYSVYNTNGMLIRREEDVQMGYKLNVDLSAQENGMYIVRIQAGTQITDQKVMLAH